ncbi:hypothetical protein EDD17DRAFT_176282 [Pisolithus thermaeus]|nr:hypothetical protein EDD17DRAFT_176282 [Pisolithus thermaeus]
MARVLPIVFSIGTSIAFVNCSARPLEAKNQTLMVAVWRIPMIIGPSFSQVCSRCSTRTSFLASYPRYLLHFPSSQLQCSSRRQASDTYYIEQLTTSVLALKVTQEGPTVRGTPNRYSDWCTE